MALLDVDTVKLFLSITGTAKDDLIEALIPQAEAIINAECNTSYTDDWPIALKVPGAMIIAYLMNNIGKAGVQSESQGDYSYTMATVAQGNLPPSIAALLTPWKQARVHFAQKTTKANDRRGLTVQDLADGKVRLEVEGIPYEDQ
jgi:hypothetical protein